MTDDANKNFSQVVPICTTRKVSKVAIRRGNVLRCLRVQSDPYGWENSCPGFKPPKKLAPP